MKVAIISRTRPEITKMAPLIRELQAQGADLFVPHIGQHYSYNLDRIFFDELGLSAPTSGAIAK
jgi:UDP-N-acetylglucosamine 2-epimerase (non-hydrolysing)